MREIGVLDAETKLGTLLDWVAKGEEIIITRHGKAVARFGTRVLSPRPN
jgi:prevent-host-death family protein